MNFFFTLDLFFFLFLNPRFEAALDKPVIASIRQVAGTETKETRYWHSADGRELRYDLAPDGGEYRVKVATLPNGFFDAIEILQIRSGARPGGDLVKFQFRYRNDTLIDSILISRNDTLERVQAYGHDSLARLISVKERYVKPGQPEGKEKGIDLIHDSSGRVLEIAGSEPGDDRFRYEYDPEGRLTARKYWEADSGEYLTGWKLHYNPSGEWTRWERFNGDSLSVVYTMEYRARDQVLGLRAPRRDGAPARKDWMGSRSFSFSARERDALGRRLYISR